jgi:hypothetical protein
MFDFQDHIRNKIHIRGDVKRYIGHINLRMVEDGVLCGKMADAYYSPSDGTRSLLLVVDMVEEKLVTELTNDGALLKYIVRLMPAANDHYELAVFKDSETE